MDRIFNVDIKIVFMIFIILDIFVLAWEWEYHSSAYYLDSQLVGIAQKE